MAALPVVLDELDPSSSTLCSCAAAAAVWGPEFLKLRDEDEELEDLLEDLRDEEEEVVSLALVGERSLVTGRPLFDLLLLAAEEEEVVDPWTLLLSKRGSLRVNVLLCAPALLTDALSLFAQSKLIVLCDFDLTLCFSSILTFSKLLLVICCICVVVVTAAVAIPDVAGGGADDGGGCCLRSRGSRTIGRTLFNRALFTGAIRGPPAVSGGGIPLIAVFYKYTFNNYTLIHTRTPINTPLYN